jgi:hypothetical protein
MKTNPFTSEVDPEVTSEVTSEVVSEELRKWGVRSPFF